MKSQVLHTVWCNISGEATGEIWHWSLLGVKGVMIFDRGSRRLLTRLLLRRSQREPSNEENVNPVRTAFECERVWTQTHLNAFRSTYVYGRYCGHKHSCTDSPPPRECLMGTAFPTGRAAVNAGRSLCGFSQTEEKKRRKHCTVIVLWVPEVSRSRRAGAEMTGGGGLGAKRSH